MKYFPLENNPLYTAIIMYIAQKFKGRKLWNGQQLSLPMYVVTIGQSFAGQNFILVSFPPSNSYAIRMYVTCKH